MAAINMPAGASNGDTHAVANGVTYQFDGDKWIVHDDPILHWLPSLLGMVIPMCIQ